MSHLPQLPVLLALCLIHSPMLAASPIHQRVQNTEEAQITAEERRDFQEAIARALFWIADWSAPLACEEREVDLEQQLERLEGKEIRLLLEVSKKSLYATLDDLHMRIQFRRLGKRGVYYSDDKRYCEDSYAEHARKLEKIQEEIKARAAETGTKTFEQMMGEIKERLARAGMVHPEEDKASEVITHREEMAFLISSSAVSGKRAQADPAEIETAKRDLYRKMLQTISTDSRFSCEKGSLIELWVPDFALGDPGIYLRVKERASWYTENGVSVIHLAFGRDENTGAYTIAGAQRIGIEDEVEHFAAKIENRPITRDSVVCGSLISR